MISFGSTERAARSRRAGARRPRARTGSRRGCRPPTARPPSSSRTSPRLKPSPAQRSARAQHLADGAHGDQRRVRILEDDLHAAADLRRLVAASAAVVMSLTTPATSIVPLVRADSRPTRQRASVVLPDPTRRRGRRSRSAPTSIDDAAEGPHARPKASREVSRGCTTGSTARVARAPDSTCCLLGRGARAARVSSRRISRATDTRGVTTGHELGERRPSGDEGRDRPRCSAGRTRTSGHLVRPRQRTRRSDRELGERADRRADRRRAGRASRGAAARGSRPGRGRLQQRPAYST